MMCLPALRHYLLQRHHRRQAHAKDVVERGNRHGLLFASGLITGETLMGILLAIPIVISGRPDVLAVLNNPMGALPGGLLLMVLAGWLYRIAKAEK